MIKNRENKVAFVGFVVPEDSRWRKTGAGRAGNLASNGFNELVSVSIATILCRLISSIHFCKSSTV